MKPNAVLQILTLSLSALLALAAPAESEAQSKPVKKPAAAKKVEPVRTRSQQESLAVAGDLTKQEMLKERLLLRYRQLWNHYRFRNVRGMSEAEKTTVDELMEASRSPNLNTTMSIGEIREAIKRNSVELEKRLRAEIQTKKDIDGGSEAVTARANLAYLKDVMIKGLYNNNLYNMTDKGFRNDFLRMMPETPLPESMASPELYPKTEVPPWLLEGLSEPPPESESNMDSKKSPNTVR